MQGIKVGVYLLRAMRPRKSGGKSTKSRSLEPLQLREPSRCNTVRRLNALCGLLGHIAIRLTVASMRYAGEAFETPIGTKTRSRAVHAFSAAE